MPIFPTSPPSDESLAATLLTEVRVLATKLDTVIENQGKADIKIENMGKFCREDMEKTYGRLNALENWKFSHNGAESVREKAEEEKKAEKVIEVVNKPQWHQAVGIYGTFFIAIAALVIAFAGFMLTWSKG